MKINFKKTAVNYIIMAIVVFCSIGYGIGLVNNNNKPVAVVPVVQTFQETIQDVLPACVYIDVVSIYGYSWSGSGVIVSPDGAIFTAGHVVEDADKITVELNDGRKFEAKGFSRLLTNDGGFINIDPNEPDEIFPYVEIGYPDLLTVGDDVFIVGSPFGHDQINTVTKGIVSHLYREISFFGEDYQIQVDAASWPGNSGGPVFNMDGEVIAILVGGMGGGNDDLSICTPVDLFCKGVFEPILDIVAEWMKSDIK